MGNIQQPTSNPVKTDIHGAGIEHPMISPSPAKWMLSVGCSMFDVFHRERQMTLDFGPWTLDFLLQVSFFHLQFPPA
jgi:hypothetical protein